MSGRGAWVTGIRRGQSASRALAAPVEWDREYGLHKISPLLDWSETEIWDYIRNKRLPYNALHDRVSRASAARRAPARCSPATMSARGRWWWERADSRECGLHPRRRSRQWRRVDGGAQLLKPAVGAGTASQRDTRMR